MSLSSLVSTADVDALVTGVTLLGSGGGGDARTFSLVLRRQLDSTSVRLHTPEELAGATVVAVGVVGATSVFLEKLPGGNELAAAVRAVARWSDRPVEAVMSIEAGGLNGITGLATALQLGLPYLDADLMGRAMPRLDQFTWSVLGLSVSPCALSEPAGQVVIFDRVAPQALERAVRSFVSHSGGWAALALRPVDMSEVQQTAIIGSLARALELGRGHRSLPESPDAATVEEALGARVLGAGLVRGLHRHPGQSARTSIHVADDTAGAVLRIECESEYLLALVDGRVAARTPDLICLLDRRTANPLPTDRLRVGNEVTVVALEGSAWWWQHEERLQAVGPAAFGLDVDERDRRGAS